MITPFNRIGALACHEHAATEAYQDALNRALPDHQMELRAIQHEHEAAASLLQSLSSDDFPFQPDFGAWELMSKALHGVEQRWGKMAALRTLHDCEVLAICEYETCLQDNSIPFKGRVIITKQLIPQARNHIKRLEELMRHPHDIFAPPARRAKQSVPPQRRTIAVADEENFLAMVDNYGN